MAKRPAPGANWRPHPLLTDSAVAFQWAHPQLYLRVWAQLDGMHCSAYTTWQGEDNRTVHHQIGQAVWRPREVTERLVVEWGLRCLRAWLEGSEPPREQ